MFKRESSSSKHAQMGAVASKDYSRGEAKKKKEQVTPSL